MPKFEDFLTEKIYDNVHGFISLTNAEKDLLGTSYFQRLNHIKQLGLSYFVFPGAVHTRFSHSLGVLHITEKLIQQIKKNKPNYIADDKHQIIRLAALLHDVGHYPLSHTIEKSYKENFTYLNGGTSELKDYCNKDDIDNFFQYYTSNDNEMHHEEMAGVVIKSNHFKKTLKKLFKINDEDIDDICRIITGKNLKEEYYIYSRLIHSKFDADQMDYMMRDTFNTGIKAPIDLDFIIRNMEVCRKKYETIGLKDSLSFNIKAVQSIEQFILAKYYWYSGILYYDKSYIVNAIAQRIYTYLLINDLIEDKFKSRTNIVTLLNENPDDFFFFNDDFFWHKLEEIIKNKNHHPNIIVKLSQMLIRREFPDIKGVDFFEKNYKNKGFIKPYSQIHTVIDSSVINAFKRQIKALNKKEGNKYVGICVNREIISIDDEVKSYLENDDINIHIKNKPCRNIIKFQNQFLQTFIYSIQDKNRKDVRLRSKRLYSFKVYDFGRILKN